jgi:D-alanyl-lipoteichoic acid biosynthesis protein DltD
MQKFLAYFFIPLLLALTLAGGLIQYDLLPPAHPSVEQAPPAPSAGMYIDKFDQNPALERLLFEPGETTTISIFGSSELSYSGEAAPQKFIPQVSNFKVKTFGHAGNQCLSILCQLLAKKKQLNNAKIAIILSPGWFESKASRGTTSSVFLEYNSEALLQAWQHEEDEVAAYARKRIADLFPEFNAPGLALRNTYFKSKAQQSFLHGLAMKPLIVSNDLLRGVISPEANFNRQSGPMPNPSPEINALPWDSIFENARKVVLAAATNNPYGIENNYFETNIGKKRGNVQAVNNQLNTELDDFMALMKFIRKEKLNVCFILSPLNTLYYKNPEALSPCINNLEKEIKGRNESEAYPLLNLYSSSGKQYDKALLSDVMHLSHYGWYRVDQFILQHFSKK